MAGGPILPSSVYCADTAGRFFPVYYTGAGSNTAPTEEGLGIKASLDADTVVQFRFPMPPSIPTGTLKLRFLALANATSGTAKWTVADAKASVGDVPSNVTLTSETQSSLTWAAGDNDKYKEVKVTLSATPSASDVLVVAVTYNTTSWTLAVVSCWIVSAIWE